MSSGNLSMHFGHELSCSESSHKLLGFPASTYKIQSHPPLRQTSLTSCEQDKGIGYHLTLPFAGLMGLGKSPTIPTQEPKDSKPCPCRNAERVLQSSCLQRGNILPSNSDPPGFVHGSILDQRLKFLDDRKKVPLIEMAHKWKSEGLAFSSILQLSGMLCFLSVKLIKLVI